jgi:hypothetical protein
MLDRKGRAHMMTFLAVPEFGSQASKVSLDAKAPVPVAQTARLASIPLLAELPAPAVEGLAAALTPAEVPPSTVLIRQGEPGMPTMPSPRDSSTCSGNGRSRGGAEMVRRRQARTVSRAVLLFSPRPGGLYHDEAYASGA